MYDMMLLQAAHDYTAREYTNHVHGLVCMNKDLSSTCTYGDVLRDGSDSGGEAKAQDASSLVQMHVHAAKKL